MYEHALAYRFAPSEHFASEHLQGFVGHGFTVKNAEEHAYRKIRAKLGLLGQPFEESRVVTSEQQLTLEEFKTIRKDWAVSRQHAEGI